MEAFSAHVTLQAKANVRSQLSFVHEHISVLDHPPKIRARDFLKTSGR